MSDYDNLLNAVQERDAPITIKINTSTSAVRKGLTKALKDFNANAQILELPTEDRAPTVKENDDGTVTVALVDRDAVGDTKFKPKFKFEIVGTDNDSQDEKV